MGPAEGVHGESGDMLRRRGLGLKALDPGCQNEKMRTVSLFVYAFEVFRGLASGNERAG